MPFTVGSMIGIPSVGFGSFNLSAMSENDIFTQGTTRDRLLQLSPLPLGLEGITVVYREIMAATEPLPDLGRSVAGLRPLNMICS